MAALYPRLRLIVLLLVAVCLGTGCNLISLPYFLMMGDDKLEPSMYKLSAVDKKRPIKVVILTYCGTTNGVEYAGVDRDLTSRMVHHLSKCARENKEQFELVPPRKVEKFKDEHPDWYTLDLPAIGKHFDVDYVIYLDVRSIELYESSGLMYRGRIAVHVSLCNMDTPSDDLAEKDYTTQYPTEGPKPADDSPVDVFRDAFLDHVAKHLAWYFTAHPVSHDVGRD